MKKLIPIIICTVAGCTTVPERLPQPAGHSIQINSLPTAEMLTHEAGYIIVGPQRNERPVREYFLYNGHKFVARPESERRQFNRDKNREEFAQLTSAQLLKRTVIVTVPFASAAFNPTYEQRIDILQLAAVADRVEVRGRTDGSGDRGSDEMIARLRAEAGKRYMIDIGVPNNIISVNYQSAGDYIADNHRASGRRKNRRVELEFFIDDFTADKLAYIDDFTADKTGEKE